MQLQVKVLSFFILLSVTTLGTSTEIKTYKGLCDASAAFAVNEDVFAVASDEDNQLRFYQLGSNKMVGIIDLSKYLSGGTEESDIEGVTKVRDEVFFVTSHGRNKDAEFKAARHQFFAVKIEMKRGKPSLSLLGKGYTKLMERILLEDKFVKYGFDTAEKLAPEDERGFNIEGLTSAPNGVLIGLRNPIPDGKAILLLVKNPKSFVQESETPDFGSPIELDLQGNGIRSIEFRQSTDDYIIVAGPYNDEKTFAIYRWSGKSDQSPTKVQNIDLTGLNPEGLFFFPSNPNQIFLVSDDGDEIFEPGSKKCKKLSKDKQRFRMATFNLDE